MRIHLLAALVATACATPGPAPDPGSLAAAETAFAAQSVREDMRAAFLANFASDGVFVRDGWKNTRETLGPGSAPPIVLDWRPVHVEVAASGDMGLSTGPWRITARGAAEPSRFGQFVSIWTRAPGGPWQVAVDLGISHPGPALWQEPLDARVSPGVPTSAPLDAAESAYSGIAARSGMRIAWADWGAADLRVYREGLDPAVSRGAASRRMWDETRHVFTVERSATAASGEFGYARGHYASPDAPARIEGYYLHVWRHEAPGWRLVADVINPVKG
jgi:ketosteroid isomerase-like protein